jgi:hypothetical protein
MSTNEDTVNISAEKAYFLQRTQVLEDVQKELVHWTKRRLWIITFTIVVVGFFGIKNIVETVTKNVITIRIEPKLQVIEKSLSDVTTQLNKAEIQGEHANEVIKNATRVVIEAGQKVQAVRILEEKATSLRNELKKLEDQIMIISTLAEVRETDLSNPIDLKIIEKIESVEKNASNQQTEQPLTVAGESAPPETSNKGNWESLLGISWVKPNDLFGRTYFLSVENRMYVWPIEIDAENNRAKFVVNTSFKSRKSGNQIVDHVWVIVGDSYEFEFADENYKLNLVDIKNAGKIPSRATFISVDKKR